MNTKLSSCICFIIFANILSGVYAYTSPPINVTPTNEPPIIPPPPCECCDTCSTCADSTKSSNPGGIGFNQGFGRAPWLGIDAPGGNVNIYIPNQGGGGSQGGDSIGTRGMFTYDQPAQGKVVRRDAALGEVTVQNAMGFQTTYGAGGKPVKTMLSLDRQCITKANGEVVEQLENRTRIVYGADNAAARIVTPSGVEAQVSDFGVEVIKDLGGIRQIWSKADGLLDFTEPSTNSVLVSWYPPSGAPGQKDPATGNYLFSGSPVKTFLFTRTVQQGRRLVSGSGCIPCSKGMIVEHIRPCGSVYETIPGTYYGLKLEERRGADFLFRYEWQYLGSPNSWSLTKGEGADIVTDSVISQPNIFPGRLQQTRTVAGADGVASSVKRELFSYDNKGFSSLRKVAVDAEGQEQVLFSAGRIDLGANAGRLSSSTNAYGGAESYLYDSDGRMTCRTQTLQGGIVQVTTNTYASVPDAEGFVDRRPIRTAVTQNGVAVSDTAYSYSSTFESVTRTDPKTGVALTTRKYLYAPASENPIARGRIKVMVNPDGSAAHYSYAEGDNGSWTETVTQGYWIPAFLTPGQSYMPPADIAQLFSALPGKSARTVNTHDFRGDIVLTESYVNTGGNVFTYAGWTTNSYNIMHKQLGSARHDGTSEMSNWICTGPVWQRNADGTTVTNTFDTAKRIKTSTHYTPFGNVTRTYNYDADNRVVSQTIATNGVTVGCGGSGCGSTYSEFDTQGRTVLAVDTIGRTNRTSYSIDNRMVSHTDPAGAIVVDSYGTDGSLLSRTGTVIRTKYYTQGVDAATGTRWGKTAYGSPAGAEYTKSYYNALGQLVLQERPSFGGATLKTVYAYNSKGQLESETRIVQGGTGTYDLPVTTYAYNQLGDRVATTQTAASVSRVQSSDSAFTLDNGIVQQTSITVQFCSDATIPAMTNSAFTRLYPLENGLLAENRQRDVRGNETVQKVVQNSTTYERTTTVTSPASTLPATSTSLAGLTISSTDQHGCATTYGYDALMRQIRSETRSGQNNERLAGTYTHYNVIGQVEYTEDAFGSRTVYGYEPGTGRRISTTQYGKPSDPVLTTYTAYDSANRTLATWGATHPVAYEYDTAGRMIAMYTYRGTAAISSYSDIAALKPQMDRTQWFYDQATSLLTNKLYADGKGPSYSYTALGQISTRTWARPSSAGQQLLTLYKYDSFGGLTNTAYSDGTPSVAFIYDALGRQKVAQTFLSASGEIVSSTTKIYSGLDLVAEIQNGVRIDRQVDAFGRPQGLAIGQDYAVEYGFDEYGRFGSVTSTVNSVVNNWQYGYLPGSHLIASVDHPSYSARKTYENSRDLITTVSNTFGSATISAFNYENDGLGRRTARVDTTPTLTVNNAFGYNLKSEVTSATMGENQYDYEYDPIGNRIYAAFNSETNTYSANPLNQYAVITNSVSSVPLCEIKPSYDYDGNMLTNGVWSYSWDAENRLKAVYSNDTLLVSNVYDHQSRRIEKSLYYGGTEIRSNAFVWDGWNLVQELMTDNGSLITNSYTWGLDLSGTLQGAGGVGGLLAVYTSPLPLGEGQGEGRTVFPFYDANGNVTEYIDASGTIRAHYAFDAFGNTISQSGDLASTFSHRFSTKYVDDEAGLYYYGYRYYAPEMGRWVNRDPIEEEGGLNLYAMIMNDLFNDSDVSGYQSRTRRNTRPKLTADDWISSLPEPEPWDPPKGPGSAGRAYDNTWNCCGCKRYLPMKGWMDVAQCCKDGEIKVAARYWVINKYPSQQDCVKKKVMDGIMVDYGKAAFVAGGVAIASKQGWIRAVVGSLSSATGKSALGVLLYVTATWAIADAECNAEQCDPLGFPAPSSWNN